MSRLLFLLILLVAWAFVIAGAVLMSTAATLTAIGGPMLVFTLGYTLGKRNAAGSWPSP